MNLWQRLKQRLAPSDEPEHLRRGRLGERAARTHLRKLGLKFLTANFRSARGEIDLNVEGLADSLLSRRVRLFSGEGRARS